MWGGLILGSLNLMVNSAGRLPATLFCRFCGSYVRMVKVRQPWLIWWYFLGRPLLPPAIFWQLLCHSSGLSGSNFHHTSTSANIRTEVGEWNEERKSKDEKKQCRAYVHHLWPAYSCYCQKIRPRVVTIVVQKNVRSQLQALTSSVSSLQNEHGTDDLKLLYASKHGYAILFTAWTQAENQLRLVLSQLRSTT